MVGGLGGRCRDSVRAPVKKTAKRAAVFLSQVEVAAKAKAEKAGRATADSLLEKSK